MSYSFQGHTYATAEEYEALFGPIRKPAPAPVDHPAASMAWVNARLAEELSRTGRDLGPVIRDWMAKELAPIRASLVSVETKLVRDERAFAVFEIKSISSTDGERWLRGTASTPSTDLVGDQVSGWTWGSHTPLCWQHDTEFPVGHCTLIQATPTGLEIEARIAKIDEPGSEIARRCDAAWTCVKNRLCRGLSIGFTALEHEAIPGSKGRRFTKVHISEISIVTCPANIDCGISMIRAIDTEPAAAQLAHEIAALRRDLDASNVETAELRGQLLARESDIAEMRKSFVAGNIDDDMRADIIAELRKDVPTYRGIWKEGAAALPKHSIVTYAGALWIASRDTPLKPGSGDDTGWTLCSKAPRNGKSAFEIARQHGWQGTSEKQWLESLRAKSGVAEPRQ
jgi:HK97 family phage prohead protease